MKTMKTITLTNAQLQLLKNLLADEAEATREQMSDCAADDDQDGLGMAQGWMDELQATYDALAAE